MEEVLRVVPLLLQPKRDALYSVDPSEQRVLLSCARMMSDEVCEASTVGLVLPLLFCRFIFIALESFFTFPQSFAIN